MDAIIETSFKGKWNLLDVTICESRRGIVPFTTSKSLTNNNCIFSSMEEISLIRCYFNLSHSHISDLLISLTLRAPSSQGS